MIAQDLEEKLWDLLVEELGLNGLTVLDFVGSKKGGKGEKARFGPSRLEQGFDLFRQGRFSLPQEEGDQWGIYLVDSQGEGFANLRHTVTLEPEKSCSCEDFSYRAHGNLAGYCKHVVSATLARDYQLIIKWRNQAEVFAYLRSRSQAQNQQQQNQAVA